MMEMKVNKDGKVEWVDERDSDTQYILFEHRLDGKVYIAKTTKGSNPVHPQGYFHMFCPTGYYYKRTWNLPMPISQIKKWDENYQTFDISKEISKYIWVKYSWVERIAPSTYGKKVEASKEEIIEEKQANKIAKGIMKEQNNE